MKRLTELSGNELVVVEYETGNIEIIDASEIEFCLEYNEGLELKFYLAKKMQMKIKQLFIKKGKGSISVRKRKAFLPNA